MRTPMCVTCVITDESKSCRGCRGHLVEGLHPNWETYRRVRKYIQTQVPKGQELLKRLHQKLADAQAILSFYSELNLSGMLILVDGTRMAQNPIGLHAEPMLFRSYDDVQSWKEIMVTEGANISDWRVFKG